MYIMHVLLAGGLFYSFLLFSYFIFPGFQHHNLLLFLGFGKLMIFFSTPFKQLANGLEKFRALFYMSVCSNIIQEFLFNFVFIFSKPALNNSHYHFYYRRYRRIITFVFHYKKNIRHTFIGKAEQNKLPQSSQRISAAGWSGYFYFSHCPFRLDNSRYSCF